MLRLVDHFPYRIPLEKNLRHLGVAQAIVETVREPLLILDSDLRVVAASRSFYQTFRVNHDEIQGRLLSELGDGQWKNLALQDALESILPEHGVLEAFEVEHDFPRLGKRIMLVDARQVCNEDLSYKLLLLAIEDVTERRASERNMQQLLNQEKLLLAEMEHRIANSLQIIASMLLLKAGAVQSEETRVHLKDAHNRVLSIAAIQQHLRPVWTRRTDRRRSLSHSPLPNVGPIDDRWQSTGDDRGRGWRRKLSVARGDEYRPHCD